MSKTLIENLNFHGPLSTCKAENTPKYRIFKGANKVQTLLKQLKKKYEKVQKTTFLSPKMVKNDPSKRSKVVKFWLKILIFEVYYRPLGLKINN